MQVLAEPDRAVFLHVVWGVQVPSFGVLRTLRVLSNWQATASEMAEASIRTGAQKT